MITLGVMGLNLALRVPKLANLTDKSTSDEKREMEKWEKSNHISLMVIKCAIPEAFRGTMSDQVDTAKAFLEDLEKRFAKNEKAKTSTILAKFISMRYTGKGNIREYIMKISDLASKLKALKLDLSEDLLVHLVLISFPAQFSQLKVSYNCQKDSWSLNELISHCVQEEDRLKQERTPSAHLASTTKDKRKDNKRKKKKEATETAPQKKQHKEPTQDGCFFCGAIVPRHTWWIDSGAITHISVYMQGCLNYRKPNDGERYIYIGDGKSIEDNRRGSLGDFSVDWDSSDSQDVVLRRKCETGEQVVVSALSRPSCFAEGSTSPWEFLMKVFVKKPGLNSVLQFDCGIYEIGPSRSVFDIHNAYYLQSTTCPGPSAYGGPYFR
ncbi:hypothetical protein GH714_034672 [Hevea brasiliensis]|uniref:Uncharacterized protein n=1 Tax=Hevea brasiliensis TaxID=3981 RepID=A0A6A6M7Y5_HEVBR|nr:hypothetical protein GH714_034672 [Hevea brasiliensis]